MKRIKYFGLISVVAFSVICFKNSYKRTNITELFNDNVEALVREVKTLEKVTIDGVLWTPQYVDKYDSSGRSTITGPSHSLNQENYPSSPVAKPGGGFYSECADLVYVTQTTNASVCYGRLLDLTPHF